MSSHTESAKHPVTLLSSDFIEDSSLFKILPETSPLLGSFTSAEPSEHRDSCNEDERPRKASACRARYIPGTDFWRQQREEISASCQVKFTGSSSKLDSSLRRNERFFASQFAVRKLDDLNKSFYGEEISRSELVNSLCQTSSSELVSYQ